MEVQRLVVDNTDLTGYVSGNVESARERRTEVEGLLNKLGSKSLLNVEELLQRTLVEERKYLELESEYLRLDPSFLSMSNKLHYNGSDITVPRFSVYPSTIEGFDEFSIGLRAMTDFVFLFYSGKINFRSRVPDVMKKHLVKATDFYQDNHDFKEGNWWKIKRSTRKKYPSSLESLSLKSKFHGLIPDETKSKTRAAKGVFGSDVYLIAETKPEEWNVQTIAKDPLVVGVFKDRCYLIDHFKTTSIEEYVRREFIS